MSSSSNNLNVTAFIKESKHLVIPLRVIKKGTKKFTTVIGKGVYGLVYKGELLLSGELTSVAVKRLDSNISGQGFKEFLTEIQLLSRYKHPNVVSLVGFCDEAGEKILVYEYAQHGSLDKHLSVAKTAPPLPWEQRIRICLDTARGLDYLHNRIAPNHRVIHRDIKSANILIGHDWKAMIADLGLSKIGRSNENDSYLITNASGTHGYCDPAYMHTGILTKESDVYSFGVVMFEVLCGRLGFMNVNNEHRFLAPLAQRYYETGRLNEIIDPYLKIEVDSNSLKRFSEIAYPCLLNERNRRPSMGLVVQKLEEIMESLKVLQRTSKVLNLSQHGPSNQAYYVLGHKTANIRDVYTLGQKLGQGQFGTTYMCTEIATGKSYACKSISKRKLISMVDVDDVRREIQIMHHLAGHKNIVTIKGSYEDALYIHIVMELCNGGELFDRIIQRGHYSERKAAELTKIIVGVVEACHSLGVMHRDLKPEKFLLVNKNDDFSLKAIDFGQSVFFKPGQIFKDVVGTPYYVAPEVLLKHYGPEADVWTAGVILYVLLSGVPPFWAAISYKHPNVVSLVGFCDEAGEKILVYEYAQHGSLDKHLSVAKTARPLPWEQRIRICFDTARGLDYLHNHIAPNHRVIHRDIKSANILIGNDWKAMIADLGLSKIGRANESDSYLITNASGTHGYCDPAYMHTGILTKESDVYSFGVVMFEVLCGRLGFMNVNNEHRFLAPLAQRYYETGRLNEIIDPYLKIEVDSNSLKRFSEIAYPCLLNERNRRPSMGLVVQKLEEIMESLKVLQRTSKVLNLSQHGPSNQAYYVLGHKTANIRDVYTLGQKLGQGQFGTTYMCTEIATGKSYACKSISKRKLISMVDVDNVRREIQIMHHLAGHKNIVTIKGSYEDALYIHIVMELCNGGELFDRIIQRGHYSERKAAELTKIIIGVVEACHSLGVMHRDLKPEKFLLVNKNDDFSLKAIDFGQSVFFKPGQIFKDVVGTPYYVAPEVLLKHYGPEADVWTAGVILYVLLSGVPPFWAETQQGIYDAVLKGFIDFESDPWPLISDGAKDLIRKMLCLRPSDRLTPHEVLCHPWICENSLAPDRALDPSVLSRMKQFSAMNNLKKMGLRVIAESLSEDEIAGLREIFKSIDTDNSGTITFNELKAGVRKYGSTMEDIEILDLMNAADVDNSGTIDYGEFLAATINLNKLEREEHLVAAFQYFDKNGNGYITVDELQQAGEEHGMADLLVEDIIREVDQDNDGRIDYREFVDMMSKGNAGVG